MVRTTFVFAVLALLTQTASATVIVQNGDFEAVTTPVTTGGQHYTEGFDGSLLKTDGVPHWTFAKSSAAAVAYDGILSTGEGWQTSFNGNQAAFLEGLGTFSQAISGFSAGNLTVSFYASGPKLGILTSDSVQVLLDSTPLTFNLNSASSITPTTTLTQYTTNSISLSAGSHTLTFSGLTNNGLAVAAIDDVTIAGSATATPEPSSIALVGLGAFSLLAYAWRKRK